MAVKIVTDSTSDISPEVAKALGIIVVPAYVKFGDEVYKHGVDITNEEFYQKLEKSLVRPEILPPTPDDFINIYTDCSKETEYILSIHFSAKTGGTYDSALLGKWMMKGKCQVEVIDSTFISVGLSLVVMSAASIASTGESLLKVFDEAKQAIGQIGMLGLFDTMKYLVPVGRISKATALVAGILNRKPLITFKNGEIVRTGLVSNDAAGMDRLCEFVERNYTIQDLAIAHSNLPEQADQLKTRLGSTFPEEEIRVAQLGPALGVHGGPGALVIAYRQGY